VVFEHVALQGNANNFPFRYSKGSYAYNETETHFIRLGILGQEYGFVELLVLGFWRERSLRLGTYGFFLSVNPRGNLISFSGRIEDLHCVKEGFFRILLSELKTSPSNATR